MHAVDCRIGGGVQQRHDGARDCVIAWMREMGLHPHKEQRVPAWDTARASAILDIAYLDAKTGTRYLDIAIVSGGTHANLPAATRIARHEQHKHTRYPGPALVPFVIDVRGMWGSEARAWLRDVKPQLSSPDPEEAIRLLKYRLSACIQGAVAEQVIRCATANKRERQAPPPTAAEARRDATITAHACPYRDHRYPSTEQGSRTAAAAVEPPVPSSPVVVASESQPAVDVVPPDLAPPYL